MGREATRRHSDGRRKPNGRRQGETSIRFRGTSGRMAFRYGRLHLSVLHMRMFILLPSLLFVTSFVLWLSSLQGTELVPLAKITISL